MGINFVGFIFFISYSFSPSFTSFIAFLSVVYLLFGFLCLFLSTCPLHLLFFYPFSYNGFLISKLFFPLVTFSFFHTNLSFVYFIVFLHFFPFCNLFVISVSFHFFFYLVLSIFLSTNPLHFLSFYACFIASFSTPPHSFNHSLFFFFLF